MMRTGILLLLWLAATPALANPHLAAGRQYLRSLQHQRALEALQRALASDNNPSVRAEILVLTGIAESHLLDDDAAARSFRRALCSSSAAKLPRVISPKIRRLFEQVRRALAAERAVVDRRACDDSAPRNSSSKPDRNSTSSHASTDSPVISRHRKTPAYRWTAWLTLGVSIAATGSAVAVGLLAKNDETHARDREVSYDDALASLDRAQSKAVLSNVLFVAAGICAVSSAALFWITRSRPSTTVGMTLMPSGVMIAVEGVASW